MSSENKTNGSSQEKTQRQKNLPIASSQDVEFSSEAADSQDLEANQRATAANNRQKSSESSE
ncbi:YfhD family protein [Paenibacillus psychroresistens]|uniref:YfhD family protein n=1 Tax=Paenibacillus psychroresistens TaxID=1778678 RepID=A0A6B8RI07_9BACL|nr:YfhD family protein [Paenibacillus psychroresistens]QGQ95709.1 YfhD family protein [Paenibacillus psychroresistens]